MKYFLFFIIPAIFLGCSQLSIDDNDKISLQYPSYFNLEKFPFLNNTVESSMIINNDQEWTYYDKGMCGSCYLIINNKKSQCINRQHGRFLYIFKIGCIFYKINTELDGVYWESSNNGIDWSKSIKFLSIIPNTIYANIWNVAVGQAPDGSWMVEIECSQIGGDSPLLIELHSSITGSSIPNFNNEQNNQYYSILPLSGNAWIQYIPNKGWLMLCGEIKNGYWVTVAYEKVNLYDQWEKENFLIFQSNIHVCDPFLTYNTHNGLSLLISYNQNEVIRLDSNLTIDQFFDIIKN